LAFYYPSELDVSNMAELTSQKWLGTVKVTFLSTSLSESLPEELEETSSFDLGILKEKCIK
jgi:hypothetical protein